jgi:hypothetical protein
VKDADAAAIISVLIKETEGDENHTCPNFLNSFTINEPGIGTGLYP